MNGCISSGTTPASEALSLLSQLSKTIGLCAQEVDQLRSDNTRIQLLLRTKCDELNASQEENRVLSNRCQQLENELKTLINNNIINEEMRHSFESQNSWDTQSEEYLANLSNDELLNGIEIICEKINPNNKTIKGKQNQSFINGMTNDNKRLKKSNDNKTDRRVETNPMASTSSNGLNAMKAVNKSQTIDSKEKRVGSNLSEVLAKYMTSTPKASNIDMRQISSSQIRDKIKITICSMNGQRMIFQVDSGESVLSLKNKLEEREGFTRVDHRLVFGGNRLEETKRLCHYNIKNGSVIHSCFQ